MSESTRCENGELCGVEHDVASLHPWPEAERRPSLHEERLLGEAEALANMLHHPPTEGDFVAAELEVREHFAQTGRYMFEANEELEKGSL